MNAAVPMNLLPEVVEAGARRVLAPIRVWRRRNWFYRRLLKGPLSDRIVIQPRDACARRLEDADALLRGRFSFQGATVEVRQGVSVFDLTPPSRIWLEELHGFSWLASLGAAGGEAARTLATNLIAQWVKRYGRYCEPQWSPHVMARRLMHIFSHGRLVIVNSDMLWRSRLFVSLREQVRMLERIAGEAPDGLAALGNGGGIGAFRPLPGRQSQKAGGGAGAAGSRDRPPDPARWRPCVPLAGRFAACLSLSDDGEGCAAGGE